MNRHYSLEAEQAVLGALLLNNAVWIDVSEQLHFKDFHKLEHQILFQLFSQKMEQNKSVDALTLSEEVKHISALKEINGEMYVFELLNQTYSTANIATYITLVKEYSLKRKFKQLITHLNDNVDEGEIKTLMQLAHKEFAQIELASLPATHGVFYQLFSDIYPQSIQWLWPKEIARGKLPILLDNLEIRGIDQLKSQTETFVQQIKAQQQQQMNQPNPLQEKINLEKTKLAEELQHNQLQNTHNTMELGLTKDSIDTDRMKLMADVQMAHNQNLVQLEKAQTERLVRAIDLILKK